MKKIINFNGTLVEENFPSISIQNKAFEGYSVRQKLLILEGKILFLEESYFNLMVSMRKMRMKIPSHFTLEYIENEINTLLYETKLTSISIDFRVFLEENLAQYIILFQPLKNAFFIQNKNFNIDIFKEIYIHPNYINLQPIVHVENFIAQKYALENEFDDCILLTPEMKIARTTLGNIYFFLGTSLIAIPQNKGAYKQAIDVEFQKFIQNNSSYSFEFQQLSPFETQKMDEIFIIEEGIGVHSVSSIRKREFSTDKTSTIFTDFYHFMVESN